MLHIYQFHHILFSTFLFRIGGPPIPGNCGHQIHLNHLVSAGRRYQGTMFIKLIYLISYRRPANTWELWSSNSFKSFRIGGPPMPGNYGHQIHLHHLIAPQSICSDLPVFVFPQCRSQTHIPEKGSLFVSTPAQ